MCGSVKEKVRLANLKWISKDRSNWMQAQRESQIISCPQVTGKMWKVIWCVLHWGVQCCNSIDTQAALLRNRTGQRLKQGDKLGDYSKNNERDDDDLSQGGNICMYWLLATCLSTRSRCLRAQLTALSSGKFFPLPSIKVILDYVAVIHLQFSPASWANPHVNQALTFAFFFSWWDRTPPPPHTHTVTTQSWGRGSGEILVGGIGLVSSLFLQLTHAFGSCSGVHLDAPFHLTSSVCCVCPTLLRLPTLSL